MASGLLIRKNQYYDSVFLMGVSKRISEAPGVRQNAVLMGSYANKLLLRDIGVDDPRVDTAQPNDLVVAVIAETPEAVEGVLEKLDQYLLGGVQAAATANPHSLEEGLQLKPNASLAVISIPGEYAAHEARKALDAGLHVFLFSDNVDIENEVTLKQLAAEKKLLVMGPDCGTAIIGGVGLGFANVVRRGPIGVIGVAGTGLQEFTSQVHNAGMGISHAIGTGGRDLSDRVGGLTTFAALDALEADPQTKVIAVVSKPPGAQTRARLMERFASCAKPVVACFLGSKPEGGSGVAGARLATTIDEAVERAISMAGSKRSEAGKDNTDVEKLLLAERAAWGQEQKYLRGILAGGTFCYQTQQMLRAAGLLVFSNTPLDAKFKLADSNCSREHSVIDMGADEYTVGRPHPMIDGTLRRQRILAEARDPQVAILLLDFILGYNASMDPVGELLDAITEAQRITERRGGHLTIVASLCGTDSDPQDAELQCRMLAEAGVIAFSTNAGAASFCSKLLQARGGSDDVAD
jgi:FdrA protein